MAALRHSCASYRLAETGDAARTAYELGNSAAMVHRHYKALVRAQSRRHSPECRYANRSGELVFAADFRTVLTMI